ncbi:hypothetical protein Tcan_01036, partial [Toxocara canis]
RIECGQSPRDTCNLLLLSVFRLSTAKQFRKARLSREHLLGRRNGEGKTERGTRRQLYRSVISGCICNGKVKAVEGCRRKEILKLGAVNSFTNSGFCFKVSCQLKPLPVLRRTNYP